MSLSIPFTSITIYQFPTTGSTVVEEEELENDGAAAGPLNNKTKKHKHNKTTKPKKLFTLMGRSRAGDGTSFIIPEWNWMFDCGAIFAPSSCPGHIFLTHTHADHVTFLTTNIVSKNRKNHGTKTQNPSTILHVPQPALSLIHNYITAHLAMVEMSQLPTSTIATTTSTTTSTNNPNEDNHDAPKKKKDDHGDENPDPEIMISLPPPAHGTVLHPVIPQHEFTIRQSGAGEFKICPIRADHRSPCFGYSIYRMKQRIAPEYAHLTSREIGELVRRRARRTKKNQNDPDDAKGQAQNSNHDDDCHANNNNDDNDTTPLFVYDRKPVLCYIGDTTHTVFDWNPQILQDHHCIVTECTFFDVDNDDCRHDGMNHNNHNNSDGHGDGDDRNPRQPPQSPPPTPPSQNVLRAAETKHTHWNQLKPIVQAHPQTIFLLTHFSLKYSALTILEFFNTEMANANIWNIHPLLVTDEIQQQWHKRQCRLRRRTKEQQEEEKQPPPNATTTHNHHGNSPQPTPLSSPLLTPPPTCQCFQCQVATTP